MVVVVGGGGGGGGGGGRGGVALGFGLLTSNLFQSSFFSF